MQDLVRPCSSNPRDYALVAQERMEAPRLARADLCERVGAQTQSLGPEVFQLRLRLFGSEQPDAGTLLRAGLGEDELGAALELEPKCRGLRSLLAGAQILQPARRHQVDEQHELAVLGRKEEPLRAPARAGEAPSFERSQRRVECLQRRHMRGPRLDDRKRADRLVELAPPRFHLRQLRQLPSLRFPWTRSG